MRKLEDLIHHCREVVEDLSLSEVVKYKKNTGKKAVGYFPVYSPVELYHAAGFLPVGLNGGGNQLEINLADSRFGSFICSIVKSTTELSMKGNLDVLDGLVFHDICDSARNLAWVTQRNAKAGLFMEYLHLPQRDSNASVTDFLTSEYQRILDNLEKHGGKKVGAADLNKSITLYNENRSLLRGLYALRAARPHDVLTSELYVIMRAGNFIPVEEHNVILKDALAGFKKRSNKTRDGVRVIVEGAFCEQPPLELLELMDRTGCYVCDDDFLLGKRWFKDGVPTGEASVRSLAESYCLLGAPSSVRHDKDNPREAALIRRYRASKAQAVIFLYAKFCEPGLFDYVLFKKAVDEAEIPHLLIEFEEKMWTFEKTRMELETFVESLLFEYA